MPGVRASLSGYNAVIKIGLADVDFISPLFLHASALSILIVEETPAG